MNPAVSGAAAGAAAAFLMSRNQKAAKPAPIWNGYVDSFQLRGIIEVNYADFGMTDPGIMDNIALYMTRTEDAGSEPGGRFYVDFVAGSQNAHYVEWGVIIEAFLVSMAEAYAKEFELDDVLVTSNIDMSLFTYKDGVPSTKTGVVNMVGLLSDYREFGHFQRLWTMRTEGELRAGPQPVRGFEFQCEPACVLQKGVPIITQKPGESMAKPIWSDVRFKLGVIESGGV